MGSKQISSSSIKGIIASWLLFLAPRRVIRFVLLFLPTVIVSGYVVWPSVRSTVSVIHFYISQKDQLTHNQDPKQMTQQIQHFFSHYRISISQSDIFIDHQKKIPYKARGCSRHTIAFYVPFLMRYPFFGHTVHEMCMVIKP